MPEAKNYLEEEVRGELERLLQRWVEVCKCGQCRADIMAFTLNRLPAKYVVSESGRLFTKAEVKKLGFRNDIIKALTDAMRLVTSKPHHHLTENKGS